MAKLIPVIVFLILLSWMNNDIKAQNTCIYPIKSNDMNSTKNVFGQPLKSCCTDPMTGFYRTGKCQTGPNDRGLHLVCAVMTQDFLDYTKAKGNDLSTPNAAYRFPGLKAGDKWCLCISRWLEAHEAGVAPLVDLEGTHQAALNYTTLSLLQEYQVEK